MKIGQYELRIYEVNLPHSEYYWRIISDSGASWETERTYENIKNAIKDGKDFIDEFKFSRVRN